MSYRAEWYACTNPAATIPGYWTVVGPNGFRQTAVDEQAAGIMAEFYRRFEAAGYDIGRGVPLAPSWVEVPPTHAVGKLPVVGD